MASLNNPFASAFAAPDAPSTYDVQRRGDLAKRLAENDKYVPNSGFLGALGQALAGSGSAFQSSLAANEGQQGLTAANAKLASLLSGTSNPSPGDLITAGGDPFLPASETGLVGDLIKRKLGIGETFGFTPIVATDAQGKVHYYQPGSLGGMREMSPNSGQQFAPTQRFLDTGTGYQAVPTNAGINLTDTGTGGTSITKNNAQEASDKAYGAYVGDLVAKAPEALQKEGQLLKTFTDQTALASNSVDQALGAVDDNFMTGLTGGLASAVPGLPAYDLAQTLLNIKSNITLGTLAQMKANAPNGASGLGSVSNFEDELLSAVNGSLDQKQSSGQLKSNLQRIKTLMDTLVKDRALAFDQDTKRLTMPPAAPPTIGSAPAPGGVPAPAAFSGKVLTYNPATGELE